MFGSNHIIKAISFLLLTAATTSQAKIYLSLSKANLACKEIQKVKVVSISAGEYMQPMSRARLMHELRLKVRALGLESAYLMRRDTDAAGQERFTAMAFRCRDKVATKADSLKPADSEKAAVAKEGLKPEPAPSQEDTEKGSNKGTEKPSSEIKPSTNQAL